jgi:hypothetical protein
VLSHICSVFEEHVMHDRGLDEADFVLQIDTWMLAWLRRPRLNVDCGCGVARIAFGRK